MQSDKITVAPIRGLDDFVLETDRFKVRTNMSVTERISLFVLLLCLSLTTQLPDFSNLQKWNNRINGNLLYYQTNYMIAVIVIFALIA